MYVCWGGGVEVFLLQQQMHRESKPMGWEGQVLGMGGEGMETKALLHKPILACFSYPPLLNTFLTL